MGGNAMQVFGARRVEAAIAHDKAFEVSQALDQVLYGHGIARSCHVIRAYREKATFGDLDLLVQQEAVEAIGMQRLVSELGALLGQDLPFRQVHPKAPQFHTALPLVGGGSLQVDFIITPEAEFDWAIEYYAWNDLSKLMQLLVRTLSGLHFGVDGLSRSVKHEGQVIGHVTFTRDFRTALEFLGYDVERYYQGFDNLNALYAFAVDHPRFQTSIYQWENRNAKGRGQDSDRPTYLGFLEWIKDKGLPETASEDGIDWVAKAHERFPDAHAQQVALMKQVDDKEQFRQRFNGELVTQLTGLQGVALGTMMKAFRKTEGEEGFIQAVLAMTDEELHQRIVAFYRLYSKLPGSRLGTPSPQ